MFHRELFKSPKNLLEGEPVAAAANVPEDVCVACKGCKKMLFTADLASSAYVCVHCGAHFRISARQRIGLMVDAGSFVELDANLTARNQLDFPGYDGKLAKAREASGEKESVICGVAAIGGRPVALFVMDGGFMMGSMGAATGEKIARLFEQATARRLPVVGFTVSGGARMQEGILSLMQMAKVSGAVGRHSQAGLLYIAVLTDPTTGGVTASFAMQGDILLAEPGALVCFAGPRVIEQTIHETLPEGFQRAEFLLEKGFLDAIVDRRELRDALGKLLALHGEVGA